MELETKVIENEKRSKSNVHRLDRLEERVNEQEKLLEKPAKRWDGVVTAVVTALISVLVGALLGRLI